ncbi:MAG: ABC transporter permease [Patescibacteria group bacterium]
MLSNWIGLGMMVRREIERMNSAVIQTLVTPWISALLYIFIFGRVVGSQITIPGDYTYIDFVLPGILMMNLISSSFAHTSFSVYFARFTKNVEELLVAPLSYWEIIFSYTIGGIIRGLAVGAGIYVIAILFSAATINHLGLFLFYSIAVSAIFSLAGIVVGLWAKSFEQLSVLSVFLFTPLTFLGGVFNSIDLFPEQLQQLIRLNPFFYFISGIRYSMIGVQESNQFGGVVLILILLIGFGFFVRSLFQRGYGIRV